MNERIKELRGQVKLDIVQYQESLLKLGAFVLADDGGNEVLNAYLEKFAELIVQKCADIGALKADGNYEVYNSIVEYFGMQEPEL
jgi:hypothetical protein